MDSDARSILMQMLAARAGGGVESMPALLSAIASGSDPAEEILKRYATQPLKEEDDEKLEVDTDVSVSPPPEPAPMENDIPTVRRVFPRRYIQLLHELSTEVSELRTRCDTLAAALGACYLCWGADQQCPECEGAGAPGWKRPDPHLFRELVAPAIERTKQIQKSTHERQHSNGSSAPIFSRKEIVNA